MCVFETRHLKIKKLNIVVQNHAVTNNFEIINRISPLKKTSLFRLNKTKLHWNDDINTHKQIPKWYNTDIWLDYIHRPCPARLKKKKIQTEWMMCLDRKGFINYCCWSQFLNSCFNTDLKIFFPTVLSLSGETRINTIFYHLTVIIII